MAARGCEGVSWAAGLRCVKALRLKQMGDLGKPQRSLTGEAGDKPKSDHKGLTAPSLTLELETDNPSHN